MLSLTIMLPPQAYPRVGFCVLFYFFIIYLPGSLGNIPFSNYAGNLGFKTKITIDGKTKALNLSETANLLLFIRMSVFCLINSLWTLGEKQIILLLSLLIFRLILLDNVYKLWKSSFIFYARVMFLITFHKLLFNYQFGGINYKKDRAKNGPLGHSLGYITHIKSFIIQHDSLKSVQQVRLKERN